MVWPIIFARPMPSSERPWPIRAARTLERWIPASSTGSDHFFTGRLGFLTGFAEEKCIEADANQIFTVVEQEPEFPGGTKALMEYISKNLRYPAFAAENGIQGRVTLSFVVEKDGSVTDIQELRSPSEDLTKEAKRVVQSMPKWKPGKQRGKPVRVKYMLPVTFRLQ